MLRHLPQNPDMNQPYSLIPPMLKTFGNHGGKSTVTSLEPRAMLRDEKLLFYVTLSI
jgi:hypothetical protein